MDMNIIFRVRFFCAGFVAVVGIVWKGGEKWGMKLGKGLKFGMRKEALIDLFKFILNFCLIHAWLILYK